MLKLKNTPVDCDGWTPQAQRGGIYCSPRCGGKCTREAYDLAVQRSAEIVAQLGDGWKANIWENLGWHWEVGKGSCIGDGIHGTGTLVRQFDDGTFVAEFRSAVNGSGSVTQFYANAKTAADAIGLVRQDVRTFISRIEADLASSL